MVCSVRGGESVGAARGCERLGAIEPLSLHRGFAGVGSSSSRGSGADRQLARNICILGSSGSESDLDSNFSSQETLVTLASDTGGKAFLDTNDFSGAFKKVQQDTSLYYLLVIAARTRQWTDAIAISRWW